MDFYVNEFMTINNFEFSSDEIIEIMKFGQNQPYKKFTGSIDDKKVQGLVCLNDDNVYDLKYL